MKIFSRVWYRLLLRPSRHGIPCTKQEQLAQTTSGTIQLLGQSTSTDANIKPSLVVLRFLGARGRAELATLDPANVIGEVRSSVWTMNPPGYGKSTSTKSVHDYSEAGLACFDSLRCKFPNSRIWIYGKSIGATLAMYVAANRKVDGLILKNIVDVPAITIRKLSKWLPVVTNNIAKTVPDELRPESWAGMIRTPTLFVIAKHDHIATPISQQHIASLFQEHKQLLFIDSGHDEVVLQPQDNQHYHDAVLQLWELSC